MMMCINKLHAQKAQNLAKVNTVSAQTQHFWDPIFLQNGRDAAPSRCEEVLMKVCNHYYCSFFGLECAVIRERK